MYHPLCRLGAEGTSSGTSPAEAGAKRALLWADTSPPHPLPWPVPTGQAVPVNRCPGVPRWAPPRCVPRPPGRIRLGLGTIPVACLGFVISVVTSNDSESLSQQDQYSSLCAVAWSGPPPSLTSGVRFGMRSESHVWTGSDNAPFPGCHLTHGGRREGDVGERLDSRTEMPRALSAGTDLGFEPHRPQVTPAAPRLPSQLRQDRLTRRCRGCGHSAGSPQQWPVARIQKSPTIGGGVGSGRSRCGGVQAPAVGHVRRGMASALAQGA